MGSKKPLSKGDDDGYETSQRQSLIHNHERRRQWILNKSTTISNSNSMRKDKEGV